MQAKDMAKLDQLMAIVGDTLPPMLWRFYKNSVDMGFDKTQALELTKAWFVSAQRAS